MKHVGIIGAGTMGGGIAMCFAQSGFRVTLVDQDQEGLERGLGIIKKNYEISVKRGRLSAEQVEGFLRNLEPTTDWQQLQNVDLVIEAVFENLELKQNVFQKLDEICAADTILASNTSIRVSMRWPPRPTGRIASSACIFLAPLMSCGYWRWFEGAASSDTTLATAMAVGKKIGKVCALSGMCYGFIGNRMLRHYGREAPFA